MAQTIKSLPIYRMVHIDSVPFIVRNGIWSKLSSVVDPDFVPIGNPDIIDKRTNKPIGIKPPGGVLGEYVPFYFSGRSPMLYNIVTGYGVKQVPQRDIVFIICDALEIIEAGIPFCYTDGNATKAISKYYNTLYGLKELDWNCIRAKIWKNTDDDFDRVRKKMSEFLVKEHLPNSFIRGFLVENESSCMKVAAMVGDTLPNCKVMVDANHDFYYLGYD